MSEPPVILFGAFDRHNFGDLLFAHLASRRLKPRATVPAELAPRDLRQHGGHRVESIVRLAAGWGARPADILHVGGELLTCTLAEAAVMLLPHDQAATAARRFHVDPEGAQAWAEAWLGPPRRIAYLAPTTLFKRPREVIFNAVGGVGLANLPADLRAEVAASLSRATYLSVRDTVTQAALADLGIAARLAPDPAASTADLFARRIRRRAMCGAPGLLRQRFPNGWLAIQIAAEFGDDATLAVLADRIADVAHQSALGVALFRAGTAPWHDDIAVCQRLAARLGDPSPVLFPSTDLWDICALLAGARAYCGSSLHGRIVAESFGVPGVNLVRDHGAMSKQRAYADTWGPADRPLCVSCGEVSEGLRAALTTPAAALRDHGDRMAAIGRRRCGEWLARLRPSVTAGP